MKNTSFLNVVMGVVIGALLVLVAQRVFERRDYVKIEDGRWSKINAVLSVVDGCYVDSVGNGKVTDAALSAILSSLDPHSVYLPPRDLEAFDSELAGDFEGIGIQFNVPNDTAMVIEVIKGGPSEKIGLRAGDRIIKVDTVGIAGVRFPQDSIVRRIKGPAGSKVLITVLRDGVEIPFEITRDKIPVNSVEAYFMVNDTTGYIRLSKFSQNTFREVESAAGELKEKGMRRLVMDLRENSGGYLDQALQLSNMFLHKGEKVVYLEGLHYPREEYYADGCGSMQDIPLSVIIDENTASSSEIFAGAIQDNSRGTVVGRRSFGKGFVQKPVYFSDNSGIRITIARFYTPSGRCIQKPYDVDNYEYEVYYRYDRGEMSNADSMKVENGGIIPDIFVPVDTSRLGAFYVGCNRKATQLRFASHFFDTHKATLSGISDLGELTRYLNGASLEENYLKYALEVDGLKPERDEWDKEKSYMMAQVKGLVGRYSKVGENAYYYMFLPVDKSLASAITGR